MGKIKRNKFKLGLLTPILLIFISNIIYLNDVFANQPKNVAISNVRDTTFTTSWITDATEAGYINYGTTSPLGNTADDVRGEFFEGTTHYVTVTNLSPNTTYYYDIVSGGVTYDEGGLHYTMTTGPTLDPPSPDTVYGLVFLSDGTTPAEGAIVYIKLRDNDGEGTTGESQICSSLVESTGFWSYGLGNVRIQTLDSYFEYSKSGDSLILEVKGPNGGVTSQIVDTKDDTSASPMTLEPNAAPVLEWTGEAGYESGGLELETGYASTDFTFRIKYIDSNNDQPAVHRVYIDKNGDGDYSDTGEANNMTATGSDYASGVIYTYATTIPYSPGSDNCSYYFEFSDGLEFATGNITKAINEATAINKPDVLQTLGITIDKNSWGITPVPIQIPAPEQVMSQGERIKVTNSGDGLQTFALRIQDEDDKGEWVHNSTEDNAGLNTYVLTAIFCGASDIPGSSDYNEGESEDVITISSQTADTTKFAYSLGSQNGQSVPPSNDIYLYFRLDLPTAVSGIHFDEEHKMTIELSCQGE